MALAALFMAAATAAPVAAQEMEPVRLSDDQRGFVLAESGRPFTPWGFNYDHDADGRLIEDYWEDEWAAVEQDFAEMKELGANVVRIHLQFGRFMEAPDRPNPAALDRLGRLVALAERTGLYLNITGLGCYHKRDVPGWYDALDEQARWEAQARFWEAVAERCAPSPAIFCYDLMNEPILPGKGKTETDWLPGEGFGGKHFVQFITLDLAGRSRPQVARAWVERMAAAIREHDPRGLITVGVIPWVFVFGGGEPLFHAPRVGEKLGFVSVHFYPRKGEIDKALKALRAYEVGKPIVVEETFPLRCSADELARFIRESRPHAAGWLCFYWGRTPEEYDEERTLQAAITAEWLRKFQGLGETIRE